MYKHRFVLFISIVLFFTSSYLFHSQLKTKHMWQHKGDFLEEKMIAVTTYNIRYGKGIDGKVDLERVISTLKHLNTDIISLQEVERYSIRSGFVDQVQLMAQALDMNVVFYPSLSYPGFYYGNAILSKYPIIDFEAIPFQETKENRTAILSKIQLNDEQSIYVLNTHLGLNKENRSLAIAEIHERISLLDHPIILTGDLNSTPEQFEYQMWDRLLTKSNFGQAIKTYHKKDWQIDYIFHSDHFVATETIVLESEASDHFPVSSMLLLIN
ncbi:endonuclease/exonuclease/phosphatase family protein [Anaerobacillus sp. MEB173]|uniref:endonuclease/exonuclease/phosphatase family protein n=1 Tax=Anaerobacillus sp. MEB173 TaxID=3383345 RepID=UPI003F93AE22